MKQRAATLGFTQSNQRIRVPARTVTWVSGWSSGLVQTRAGGGHMGRGEKEERLPWLSLDFSGVKEELPGM